MTTLPNPGVQQGTTAKIIQQYLDWISGNPILNCSLKLFKADLAVAFACPFSPDDYSAAIEATQNRRQLKTWILQELHDLSRMFPAIPPILWHCIAHVVFREDPFTKASLLRDKQDTFLYGDAVLNDTALHAAGIVVKLMHFINARMTNRFGIIIIHGHSCDCCVEAVKNGHVSLGKLSTREIEDLSTCFFGHFCAELVKTRLLGLPLAIET